MPMCRFLLSACLLLAIAPLRAEAPAPDCGLAVARIEQVFGAPASLLDVRGDGVTAPRQCRFLGPDIVLRVSLHADPGEDAESVAATPVIEGAAVLAWRRAGQRVQVEAFADALLRENGQLSTLRFEQLVKSLAALRDGGGAGATQASDGDCGARRYCLRSATPGLLRQPLAGLEWTQQQGPAGTWQQAEAWCRERGDGWRLPRRTELSSLADTEGGQRNTCGRHRCPVSPLLVLDGGGVWSGEADGKLQKWASDLALQREHPMNPDYAANRVLCVREPG